MAITVDSARSARERRSNSQSGKNACVAQLRHCHIDCADTGVEVAVAVPVAVVDPLGGSDAVFGAADGVGLGGEDLVDKPLQHLPHQIRGGLGEQIIQVRCRVDRMRGSGYRRMSFGEMWKLSRKVTGGGRPTIWQGPPSASVTPH